MCRPGCGPLLYISPNPGHAYNTTHVYRAFSKGPVLAINYLNDTVIATCYGLGISSTLSYSTNAETEVYIWVKKISQGHPASRVVEQAALESELDARTCAANHCTL